MFNFSKNNINLRFDSHKILKFVSISKNIYHWIFCAFILYAFCQSIPNLNNLFVDLFYSWSIRVDSLRERSLWDVCTTNVMKNCTFACIESCFFSLWAFMWCFDYESDVWCVCSALTLSKYELIIYVIFKQMFDQYLVFMIKRTVNLSSADNSLIKMNVLPAIGMRSERGRERQ